MVKLAHIIQFIEKYSVYLRNYSQAALTSSRASPPKTRNPRGPIKPNSSLAVGCTNDFTNEGTSTDFGPPRPQLGHRRDDSCQHYLGTRYVWRCPRHQARHIQRRIPLPQVYHCRLHVAVGSTPLGYSLRSIDFQQRHHTDGGIGYDSRCIVPRW